MGLSAAQKARIEAAFAKVFDVLAGDVVTYVTPTGTQKTLLTIQYDLEREEGLLIDYQGLRDRGVRELIFLKSYVVAQGVTLDPAGYFLIGGKRWDFAPDETIQDTVVPIQALHSLIIIRVRQAIEKESTQSGTQWGYDL